MSARGAIWQRLPVRQQLSACQAMKRRTASATAHGSGKHNEQDGNGNAAQGADSQMLFRPPTSLDRAYRKR